MNGTHLPDCPGDETMCNECGRDWCICEVLRACRERTLDEVRGELTALTEDMANWSSAETRDATAAVPDLTVDQWVWAQRGVERANRAVDGMRGVSPSNPTA